MHIFHHWFGAAFVSLWKLHLTKSGDVIFLSFEENIEHLSEPISGAVEYTNIIFSPRDSFNIHTSEQ